MSFQSKVVRFFTICNISVLKYIGIKIDDDIDCIMHIICNIYTRYSIPWI